MDDGGNVSGNWEFVFTPAAGTPALTGATGSLDQAAAAGAQGAFTTAVLLVTAPCYADAPQVPIQGFAAGSALTLNSFGVSGQFLNLTTTIAGGGGTLSGTYAVTNGCAAGAKGSVTGVRFAPLTGTYAGPTSGGGTLSLALTQATVPAGDGTFLLGGRMTATGFTCFADGATVVPATGGADGSLSGPTAAVAFVTDEAAGSRLSVAGTFDTAAKTLTVTRYVVQGGACDGQAGTAVLTLVP